MQATLKKENIVPTGRVRIIQKKAGTEEIISIGDWTDNIVVRGTDTGADIILDRLNGDNTYSLNLTYADIGTSATAPTIADTVLGAPVARALKAYGAVSGNVLTLQYFFTNAALANGTYREFGTYVDGSATLSTGKLFNHVLFSSAYVKTSGVDTTVEVQFTVT